MQVRCGQPARPVDGHIANFSTPLVGVVITVQCDEGFVPMPAITTTCTPAGVWSPPPDQHNCTRETGRVYYMTT